MPAGDLPKQTYDQVEKDEGDGHRGGRDLPHSVVSCGGGSTVPIGVVRREVTTASGDRANGPTFESPLAERPRNERGTPVKTPQTATARRYRLASDQLARAPDGA